MPTWDELRPKNYFSADMLPTPKVFTIKGWATEVIKSKDKDGDDKRSMVLLFEETPTKCVLNTTRFNALQEIFGKNADDAIGKKITLCRGKTRGLNGKPCDCVEIQKA